MSLRDYANDPFLQRLPTEQEAEIEGKIRDWGLQDQAFYERLDNWFSNFESEEDKRLAYKIFMRIKYYNYRQFTRRLEQLYDSIKRHLHATNNDPGNLVLVTPPGEGDSADRHAYDLIKSWGLSKEQVCSVAELDPRAFTDPVFILFNDTHGTGNQFLRDIWPRLKQFGEHKIFVLAIAISQEALHRFRREMPRVHVIPHIPVQSVWALFTGEECQRIQALGQKVYPKHPMGYGNAGLLTAYYFQCPNNSLPLIWADGKNNTVDGAAYAWRPLFPYIPKRLSKGEVPKARNLSKTELGKRAAPSSQDRNILAGEGARKTEAPSGSGFRYHYRVALIDIDLGLANLLQLAQELNRIQGFFHFTCPRIENVDRARNALLDIGGIRNLDVYGIPEPFFSEYSDLAVDLVACFTRYPLAFTDEYVHYNYFSGPSATDARFMFVSANQLQLFTREAGCTFEQGLVYILVGQLVVYFTDIGYHEETWKCPMDFCRIRSEIIKGLKARAFCDKCAPRLKDKALHKALDALLLWAPINTNGMVVNCAR